MLTRRDLLKTLPSFAAPQLPPIFSFGLLADIQYANQPDHGPRRYRDSLRKVEEWRKTIAGENLLFILHLGDLFDQGIENLDAALKALESLHPRIRHVLGNHDCTVARRTVLARLGLRRAYYDFAFRNWRFLVLDGMDVAAKGGWPDAHANASAGRKMLAELQAAGLLHANDWNGAVGRRQLAWLRDTLASARRHGQRAIVCGHFPLLPEGCRPEHVTWNYHEVLNLLDQSPAAAYFSGHDHQGGYGVRGGLHFLTLKGLVEHEPGQACHIVDVYPDRLALRGGVGLPLRPATAADRWQTLFDGRTLNGWRIECKPEDRGKTFWSVGDGAIVCDSTGRKDHDYVWLLSEAEFSDFELELEVMGFADSPGNSGLQFRSRYDRELGWLHGPQIDIHPPAPFRTGLIYDETREARRWIYPSLVDWRIEPSDAPHKYYWNAAGWNRIRLVCEGPRVRSWLNGYPVANYDGAGVLDDPAHRHRRAGLQGHFALQLHARDELRIRYRNIHVRPLS